MPSTTAVPSKTPTDEYEEYSDKQLIERYLAGDSEAFTVLYQRHNDMLYSFLMSNRGLGPEDAADILSLTWEKLVKHLHRYDDQKAKFTSWACLIASRLASNFYRNRGRHPDEDVPPGRSLDAHQEQKARNLRPLREKLSGAKHPEIRPLLNDKISEALDEALDRLSPKQKRTISLRWSTPLRYSEIGDKLDVPLGTVKSRLSRSREHLREYFRDEHPELVEYVRQLL